MDSDEDLDAAIKDLLKTKKKVKKKVRDLKARKSDKPFEASSLDAIKKQKPLTEQKCIPLNKLVKSSILKGGKESLNIQAKNDKVPKSKPAKGKCEVQNFKPSKSFAQTDKVTGNGGISSAPGGDTLSPSLHADDDSDVDSDDSIEREIRRFLAERAKVSAPVTTNIKSEEKGINSSSAETEENPDLQKTRTETPVSAATSTSGRLWKTELTGTSTKSTETPAELNKGPVLTPGSSCIMGFRRTESQKPENSAPRDPTNGSCQTGKDTPTGHVIKPNSFTPPCVNSETARPLGHQHQNLFLMRPVNNRMSESSSRNSNDIPISHQSRSAPRIPLREVITSLCPSPLSKTQINSPAVDLSTSVPPLSRTEGVYMHNRLKRDRHFSDRPHISFSTSHLCQPSPELQSRQGVSVIQVQRDQAVLFQATNRLQVSQTEATASLGETQREGGSVSKEDEEEKCIDETDVESDEERKDQKTKDTSKQTNNQ